MPLDNILQMLRMQNIFGQGNQFPGSNIPGATPPIVPWNPNVPSPIQTQQQPLDENKFKQWYQQHANQWGLDPDPDNPAHFYDYRGAYRAGATPDLQGHWPSEFKREGHPKMIVDGVNTKTGQPAFDIGFDRPTRQVYEQPPNRIEELYKPDTRATDRLYQMLDQFPQMNKPGKLRKIGASLIGLGGDREAQNEVLYAPYLQQMRQFGPQFEAVKDVASQERMNNATLRQIATSILNQETADRRLDITEQRNRDLAKNAEARTEIARKRAEAYDFKSRNPNFVFKTTEDGKIVAINPQDPTQQIDTGLKSNELSDVDKANLQIDVARARIGMQEAASSRLERQRQTGREKLVNLRADRRATALKTDRQMSVTQDAAAWNLARKQFIADNPEYRDFWDEGGNIILQNAEDSDDYADAVEQIRDRYNRIKARAGGRTTPTGSTLPVKEPTPQAGRVIVEKDGKKYSLPAGQLKQALSQGYKEVK